ncbi:hypothetical protein OG799_04190 [Micromonospora sp. NBC_00898]|uniref:hypothetical protein n=1 Tax=Micromonospora sp. NBC_00898 TaxID=2975981 RepID=UPI00386E1546|nr:hypothetical protein OG799_04190 [Micromonospora sp. NBC_00898]
MKRCRHGGETLKRARRLRAEGSFAAALDDYLAVLADHPADTTVCRRPILMETAWLAYALGCSELAGVCASAAYQEAVLGRAEAPALLLMALVDAGKGERERSEQRLGEARARARWSPALRRRIRLGAVVVGVLASADGEALRGRGRRDRALARLAYACALDIRDHPDEAAEHFARARAEFERLRPVRRLRRRGRPGARRYRDALAELGWAGAVAGQGRSAPDAQLAAATLAARGATERAMRLNPDLPPAERRNPSLFLYADDTLVKRWSDLIGGDPDRSWLTPADAETLVSRLIDVYGRLRATDPDHFTPGDRLTARTLALYGDRMGYPGLALEASRAELRIARSEAGTGDELGWEQVAWVLRRQAVCLRDAGVADGRIPLLVEAAELYRQNTTTESGRNTVRRLGDEIVSLHLAGGDWASATAATVASQRRLAAMSGDDPLPGIAAALGMLHAKSLNNAPPGVAHGLATERTEVLRILTGRDPATFAGEYGEHLLTLMHSRPDVTGPVREASTLARGLGNAVLRLRVTREAARRMLTDRPDEALAILDEAIAAGPLPKGAAAEEAEAHRLRADCLRLLGREAEQVNALRREAEVKLRYAGSTFPHQRLLTIEDVLWKAGRIDAALALVDKAVDAVSDGSDAAGMLRLRRTERAAELLRDAEALEELAVVAERYPLLAARCQAAYGLVHWRAQRRDDAIAALDESLRLFDGQHYARQMRGVFRRMLGDSRAAFDDLTMAARVGPCRWTTRAALSETHLLLGDGEAAVREGHLAADLAPGQAATHAAYGLALLATGDRREALDELDAAMALRRTFAPLSLPRLLVARGDPEAASREIREAMETDPAPYLVWETAIDLRQLAAALPETADGCATMLQVLALAGKPPETGNATG